MVIDGTLKRMESKYSKREHNHEDWEPDWVTERFSCLLQCGHRFCGEIVTVAGDVVQEMIQSYDNNGVDYDYETRFAPHMMHPAPSVFPLPKKLPNECTEHLKTAFELMWVDSSSSINRIRIFVEALLDHFEIPCMEQNKKGEPYRLGLGRRIDLFEEKMPGHKVVFDALRWIGNIGSHGEAVKWDTLIKAFQLTEYVIDEVILKRAAHIKSIAQHIVDNKGKI